MIKYCKDCLRNLTCDKKMLNSNNCENFEYAKWEIADLHHAGKHPIRLSIKKDKKYRYTYCIPCGKVVPFERVPMEKL